MTPGIAVKFVVLFHGGSERIFENFSQDVLEMYRNISTWTLELPPE